MNTVALCVFVLLCGVALGALIQLIIAKKAAHKNVHHHAHDHAQEQPEREQQIDVEQGVASSQIGVAKTAPPGSGKRWTPIESIDIKS